MTRLGTTRLVVVAVAMLGLCGIAPIASAETEVFGLKVDGEVELGGRVFLDEPSQRAKAKLEEYRDLSQQPFGALRFRLFRPDESYAVELGGEKIGQEDQHFFLSSGRLGLWNFDFDWDQIPHVFSTNARLLSTESGQGVFSLPTPRPSLSTYNTGRTLDEVSTRWDTARFSILLTPTPDIDVKAEYTRIKKDGQRPMGMGFGSPGGNFIEVLEPIDQTIHDFRLRATFVGDGWQVQGGYTLSIFQNDTTALIAANPCFGLSECSASDRTGPASGRISLAPDNIAHTVTLSGGVNLPMRTRVTGNFSYSLRLQDDQFLPHTSNAAVASSPLLALPAQSLDGRVDTFLFGLNATSRPLPPLTLSLKYRIFDYNDHSKELVFPGHIINDHAPPVVESRSTTPSNYTKQNADLDAKWRFGEPIALTAGGGWERWDRSAHREVPTSDEYFGKLAIDVTPFDWLLARLAYRPSFRRISSYNPFAHPEHAVEEEDINDLISQGQSVLVRKFDEAARDRQRVDLLLQISPTDVISVTPTLGYRHDDYIDSTLGLQKAETWSGGLDVGWTPREWLSVTAGYVYESIDQQQRSRYREPTIDAVDFDWVSKSADVVHTIHAGLKATLIPKVLDWTLDLAYSKARGEVKTQNPVKPTSGTAAQRTSATAQPFPDFEDSLLRVETTFRYYFSKAWTASLGYIFEKFDQSDWRTDTLNPFVPGVTSIWLGNDLKDYTAHIVVATIGYHFQ